MTKKIIDDAVKYPIISVALNEDFAINCRTCKSLLLAVLRGLCVVQFPNSIVTRATEEVGHVGRTPALRSIVSVFVTALAPCCQLTAVEDRGKG